MTLSENKNEKNLLATSTGVEEYASAIRSWMKREMEEDEFFRWKNDHFAFDLKNHCDSRIDQKVEVCRDTDWLGHKSGQTFYKRPSGKSLL